MHEKPIPLTVTMLIRLDHTGSSPLNVLKQVKLYVSLCLFLVDSLANMQSGVMDVVFFTYIYIHCFRRFNRIWTPSLGNIVAPSIILSLSSSELPGRTVKFLNVLTIVILPSSWASRRPTHVLGPLPKGIHAKGWRVALFSTLNLKSEIQNLK